MTTTESAKEIARDARAGKRPDRGAVKVAAYSAVIVLVVALSVLADFITADSSLGMFTTAEYWIRVATVQTAVIVLIFSSRTLAKEKEMGRNKTFISLTDSLQAAFKTINDDNLNGVFKDYIDADNRRRKLEAYREKLHGRLQKYQDRVKRAELSKGRIETRARAKEKEPGGWRYRLLMGRIEKLGDHVSFWQGKIERSDAEVDFVRVKYIKWSYGVIFGGAEASAAEENDPRTHEGRDNLKLLATKIIWIVAFAVIAGSSLEVAFSFSAALVYKTIIKLFQIALGIYTGTVAGQTFIRNKLTSKLMVRFNYVKQFREKRAKSAAHPAEAAPVKAA